MGQEPQPHPLPWFGLEGAGGSGRGWRGHAPHVYVTVSKATGGGEAGWRRIDLTERRLTEALGPGVGVGVGVGREAGISVFASSLADVKETEGRTGSVCWFIQQTFIELEPCLVLCLGTRLGWRMIRTLCSWVNCELK